VGEEACLSAVLMDAISVNPTDTQKCSKFHLNLIEFIIIVMGTLRVAVVLWKTASNYKMTGRHMWYMLIIHEPLEAGRPE
jgi:hypothetical protein